MKTKKTKTGLNYKQTFLIGFGFMGCMLMWSVYNSYVPVIFRAKLTELTSLKLGNKVTLHASNGMQVTATTTDGVAEIVDIIDSGNEAGVRIAKEEYETLTGEEWKGVDAAEAWLQENYVPPEEDE